MTLLNDYQGEAGKASPGQAGHYHGQLWHNHKDGNRPHEHGWPAGHNSGGPTAVSLVFGIPIAAFGGLAMLAEGNNHSLCSDALVQAFNQSQCSNVNTIWTLGLIGLIVGVLLVVVGVVVRPKPPV